MLSLIESVLRYDVHSSVLLIFIVDKVVFSDSLEQIIMLCLLCRMLPSVTLLRRIQQGKSVNKPIANSMMFTKDVIREAEYKI